jgi:hypothetical protein
MRDTGARRAATVIGLFAALFAVRFLVESPTYTGATCLRGGAAAVAGGLPRG